MGRFLVSRAAPSKAKQIKWNEINLSHDPLPVQEQVQRHPPSLELLGTKEQRPVYGLGSKTVGVKVRVQRIAFVNRRGFFPVQILVVA